MDIGRRDHGFTCGASLVTALVRRLPDGLRRFATNVFTYTARDLGGLSTRYFFDAGAGLPSHA